MKVAELTTKIRINRDWKTKGFDNMLILFHSFNAIHFAKYLSYMHNILTVFYWTHIVKFLLKCCASIIFSKLLKCSNKISEVRLVTN